MPRSIRWRLQLWYALVLLLVVGAFASILYYRARSALLQEIDTALVSGAQYLDAELRRFPPHELEGLPPPPEFGPPRRGPEGRPPPRGPGPPNRKRLLAELSLPPADPSSPGPRSDAYFAVWRTDGTLLKKSNTVREGLSPPRAKAALSHEPALRQVGEFRETLLLGPIGSRIVVGRSIEREWNDLHPFAWQLAGWGALAVAIGLSGGWMVSARIFRPIAAISTTASRISASQLAERINPADVDRELQELAGVLNAMFDRLEADFERQARFTADASHELRTPLAVLRSHAELALSRPRAPDEYQATLRTCLGAVERMTTLVDGLLTLARADAGKLDLQAETIDLDDLVQESAELLQPLAVERNIQIRLELSPALVHGDRDRLSQVIVNLLTNAIVYNQPKGEVDVRVSAGENACLAVRNTGPGIPAEDLPHIFERFYRVDKARSRAHGGIGLGLAICKTIVLAHGGQILAESQPSRATTFTVKLPKAQ
jgi:heavy metal sensor kinase